MQVLEGQANAAVGHRPAVQQEPSPVTPPDGGCHSDGGPMSDLNSLDVVSQVLDVLDAALAQPMAEVGHLAALDQLAKYDRADLLRIASGLVAVVVSEWAPSDPDRWLKRMR